MFKLLPATLLALVTAVSLPGSVVAESYTELGSSRREDCLAVGLELAPVLTRQLSRSAVLLNRTGAPVEYGVGDEGKQILPADSQTSIDFKDPLGHTTVYFYNGDSALPRVVLVKAGQNYQFRNCK